ncbi:MAG: type I methionyl aminopeptidase [Candidatus Gracilibacteria bacterium]|jgi:methionyl aminopeptidase
MRGKVSIKTPNQIRAMRESGKALAVILSELEKVLEVGMSTMDLERKAEELFKRYQVQPGFKGYNGYPNILCTSVNDEVVHTIPNKIPMQKGDILSIDCGVIIDGMNSDSAVACIVGNETISEAKRLVDTCITALWSGVAQAKPGNHVGDIGHAIQTIVEAAGFSIIRELTGHGIGTRLHEPPFVCNYGEPGEGEELVPGMCIAIEPIIAMGRPEIQTLDDDWTIITEDGSLAIQHEHTLLITDRGNEILTLREGEKRQ